jgi:YNFM family putative membrane transporter
MSAPPVLLRPGTGAYRRFSLAMLIAGFATFSLLYSVQPMLPLFADEFRLSAAEASLAVSLATGPMAIAILAAGAISDRIGRRAMMIYALFSSALLSLVSALAPGWTSLLILRLLTGFALAGIPAVAMAFIAEEVEAASVGTAMGLYIAGSAIGGMTGRLGAGVLADLEGWRLAIGGVGAVSVVGAILFRAWVPQAAGFVPRPGGRGSFIAGARRLFADRAMPWLFAEAFLLMGAFVTIYNYAGFRLLAPPYALSQATVGAIFLLYILGSFSSAWFGKLAGKVGRRKLFWAPILILLAGSAVSAARPLWLMIAGIALVTIGFFGGHSIASSWVGRRARADRGQASALYLFFYYLGSSLLGSAGGVAWTRGGWPAVAGFVAALSAAAILIAIRLAFVAPLSENVDQTGEALPPG